MATVTGASYSPIVSAVLPTLVGLTNGNYYFINADGTFSPALGGGNPATTNLNAFLQPGYNLFTAPPGTDGAMFSVITVNAALTGAVGLTLGLYPMTWPPAPATQPSAIYAVTPVNVAGAASGLPF